MADKPWDNEELIRKLYWHDEMNMRQIGNILDCSANTIMDRMRKNKIPVRARKEFSSIASTRGAYDGLKSKSRFWLHLDDIKRMYLDEMMSLNDIANHFGCACGSIYNFMVKNDIPVRSPKQAGKLRTGENSAAWRGGRNQSPAGYIKLSIHHLSENEQKLFESMICWDCIFEHRLVVARMLNRPLRSDEVVHHLNGIKQDNRPENLLLMKADSHLNYIPALKKRIRDLEIKIDELESEKQLYLQMTGG